jgi:transposase
LKTAIAETQARIAAVEKKIEASTINPGEVGDLDKAVSRKERKARALPEHLPRVERVIEPESIVCPCGCGNMVRIGEDRTERLDRVPARYEVIVTIRPKYACPRVEGASSGQSAGTSFGRELADRSPSGGDCRLQAFRTYAAQPAG